MEIKLDFLKKFIDPSTIHLTPRTPKKSNNSYSRGSFTSRSPNKKISISSISRLYPQDYKKLPLHSKFSEAESKGNLLENKDKKKNYNSENSQKSSSLCVRFSKILASFNDDIELTPPRVKKQDLTLNQAISKVNEHQSKS